MAVKGVIFEKASKDKDLDLKRRQRSTSAESLNSPSSFETPRTSSVSTTPGSSGTSSVKSTPVREKPSKYVSKMAKAREEKKRQAAQSSNSSEKSTSSELETSSSILSTESGILSEKPQSNEYKAGNLPKFGEWNKHSANSGPCYTLLFQNAAQEKKTGAPVRIHGERTEATSAPTKDLYRYRKTAPVKTPMKTKKTGGFLCCFKASDSSY